MDKIALNAARRAGRLLVATDNITDGPYSVVRGVGVELAKETGVPIVLYDRTSESFFVDPYPSGPWTAQVEGPDGTQLLGPGQLSVMGRAYLSEQVQAARDAGVDARAWLPRRTGAKAMRECLELFGLGAAVLSDEITSPTLRDRVRGNTIDKFRNTVSVPLILVSPDRSVSVVPKREPQPV